MRTTFTVASDLAPRLKRLRREKGVSMAQLVNALVRSGLEREPGRRKPYKLKTTWRARSLVGSLDDIGEVLSLGEGGVRWKNPLEARRPQR